MAKIEDNTFYVASPKVEEKTPEGEYIYLARKFGDQRAPALRVRKEHAAGMIAAGYKPVTEEDMKILHYAAEKMSLADRAAALSGTYAPMFGIIDGIRTAGMTAEEKSLRREAAELYSTPGEKFLFQGLPVAAEFAITRRVSGALGAAAQTVRGAAALGAAQGAISVADQVLNNPKVTGEALALTMFTGTALGAGAQALTNRLGQAVVQRIGRAAGNPTVQDMARQDEIAVRALGALGFGKKTIQREGREVGGIAEFARDLNRRGLVADDIPQARIQIAEREALMRQTFDTIERQSAAAGHAVRAGDMMSRLRAVRADLVRQNPSQRRAVIMAADRLSDQINSAPQMNLAQLKQFKAVVGERARWGANGQRATEIEEAVNKGFWRHLSELEDGMLNRLDNTGEAYRAWNSAQRDSALIKQMRVAMATRQRAEAAQHGVQMNQWFNLGLAGLFGLSGNSAGLIFNGGWAGFRGFRHFTSTPSYLIGQIEPGIRQGAVRNMTRMVQERVNEAAVLAASRQAGAVGRAVDPYFSQEAKNEREQTIRENIGAYRDILRSEMLGGTSALKHSEVLDEVGNYSSDQQIANVMAVGNIVRAVEKHVPAKQLGMLLDQGYDEEEAPISDMDKEKMFEVVQAIVNPLDAMEKPTALQMKVMADAYPEMVNSFRQRLLAELVEKQAQGIKFTLEDKEDIGMYLNIGASRENDPQFIARLQKFLSSLQAQQDAPPPQRSPSASQFGRSSAENTSTPSERAGKL